VALAGAKPSSVGSLLLLERDHRARTTREPHGHSMGSPRRRRPNLAGRERISEGVTTRLLGEVIAKPSGRCQHSDADTQVASCRSVSGQCPRGAEDVVVWQLARPGAEPALRDHTRISSGQPPTLCQPTKPSKIQRWWKEVLAEKVTRTPRYRLGESQSSLTGTRSFCN
jgi:hypothetical protein